jgi:hypothetical protein
MTVRGLVGAVLIGVCCLGLTGCEAMQLTGMKHKQVAYASWTDASGHTTPATALPEFVPHDASDIYLRTLLDGSGATLTFTSASPLSLTLCQPGELTGKPLLQSNWWPIEKPPATGMLCSPGWRVFVKGGVTYAWLDES